MINTINHQSNYFITATPLYNESTIEKWTKGCILPFPKKSDLGIAKNYLSITLISTAANICNALLLNLIEPEIEKILKKNQNGFRRKRSTTSQILPIRRIIEGVRIKKLEAILLFVDFSKAFDSLHRGKMEQILSRIWFPSKTVSVIMMLYKITKVKVRSLHRDSDFLTFLLVFCEGIHEPHICS